MIHHLTREQFRNLFNNNTENSGQAIEYRKEYMREHYPQFQYIETSAPKSKAFWGRISGKEKDITWFILSK